jgi:hypothetical protein
MNGSADGLAERAQNQNLKVWVIPQEEIYSEWQSEFSSKASWAQESDYASTGPLQSPNPKDTCLHPKHTVKPGGTGSSEVLWAQHM